MLVCTMTRPSRKYATRRTQRRLRLFAHEIMVCSCSRQSCRKVSALSACSVSLRPINNAAELKSRAGWPDSLSSRCLLARSRKDQAYHWYSRKGQGERVMLGKGQEPCACYC